MWTRDNLDVPRGLNDDCIDVVYADPPFNSNKSYEAPIGSKAAGAAFKGTPGMLSDVDVAWHGGLLRHGHWPTIDRADELCRALGITMMIGGESSNDQAES